VKGVSRGDQQTHWLESVWGKVANAVFQNAKIPSKLAQLQQHFC